MFQALDTMMSLGVIFLILSMINKYLISFVKRILKIKARVITKEMEVFVGKKTSVYLVKYLKKKAEYLNVMDGKKFLRPLNKEQLVELIGDLAKYL